MLRSLGSHRRAAGRNLVMGDALDEASDIDPCGGAVTDRNVQARPLDRAPNFRSSENLLRFATGHFIVGR